MRLEQRRLLAHEQRLEALLLADRPEDVLATTEDVLRTDPFREPFWAARIRALALTGRPIDAVRCYQTARDTFIEETGIEAGAFGGIVDWQHSNDYEIFPRWRHRYPPGTTHNTEHVFALEVPEPVAVRLDPREHRSYVWLPWEEAAAKCFSWSNRDAIRLLPERFGTAAD